MILGNSSESPTAEPSRRYAGDMVRPSRAVPRDLVPNWPDGPAGEATGAVAIQFIKNLRAAIGATSLRAAAATCGVSHSTLSRVLDGHAWPDMATIAKLEDGLNAELWPARGSRQ